MVQIGHAIDVERRWEDLASLKTHLRAAHKGTIREYIRKVHQTTTNADVDVEELSGETLTAMGASKALEVWQKTDQKATDGLFTGTVEWQDVLGNVTAATFELGGTGKTPQPTSRSLPRSRPLARFGVL